MNRRQRVALFAGLALVFFNLLCPHTRFMPPPPSASLIQGPPTEAQQIQMLWEELDMEPRNGFRPIWLTPDPFLIDGPPDLLSYDMGVVWPLVVSIVSGIACSTLIAVALLGGRDWRRAMMARLRGMLTRLRYRPRFSIRGLMVAVVLTALALEAAQFPRWLEYHRKAVYYRTAGVIRWPASSNATESEAQLKRVSEWADAMKAKYERAQLRPWLAVEPDPPCPW